ncbi:MAG: ornithine cyclodeaminase family protein [Acidimicrobiales bacterium]
MTRIIGTDDLATIVAEVGLTQFLDELIGRLRSSLCTFDPKTVDTMDRTGFHYDEPGLGLIEWMPAMTVGRRVSIKTVGYHPSNPELRGWPSVLATTSTYDTTDGRLLQVCEANVLTALRTGAASALATDVLARPESTVLGMVGCGAQAVAQIHAVSRVRPIDTVLAVDVAPAVAGSLAARLAPLELGIEVHPLGPDALGRVMAEADILCTATTVAPGSGPVVPESEHRPWLHINAVGADFPGKIELPARYLDRALVCPDVPGQCLAEGEAQQLRAADLGPDLAHVVRNAAEYVGYRQRLTVFDSTGWAFEDLVAAELVGDHAERLGLGVEVDLQPPTTDPYDPYLALNR